MKKVRIISIVIFLIALFLSKGYEFLEQRENNKIGPVISMEEKTIEIKTTDEEEKILEGIVAEDDKDGDVSSSLVIESMTKFIEKGKRQVTIAAFDSDNNVTKVTREVIYEDYESPKFMLQEPLYFPINKTINVTGAMTVTDLLDGDLSRDIKVATDYKATLDLVGDYPALFTVANSAGDVVKLPVTVTLYDSAKRLEAPIIELTEYLIYIEQGTLVDQWSYVKSVTYRGETYIPGKTSDGRYVLIQDVEDSGKVPKYLTDIEITNEVEIRQPGVYEITYKVTGPGAEEKIQIGTMRLIVVVTE